MISPYARGAGCSLTSEWPRLTRSCGGCPRCCSAGGQLSLGQVSLSIIVEQDVYSRHCWLVWADFPNQ